VAVAQFQRQVADRTALHELRIEQALAITIEDAEHALDRIANTLEHGVITCAHRLALYQRAPRAAGPPWWGKSNTGCRYRHRLSFRISAMPVVA